MVRKSRSAGAGGPAGGTPRRSGGAGAFGRLGTLRGGALAGAVKDSAHQIWLAGLGAFSKAQAERGKVFEALVDEGRRLQQRTQGVAEDKIHEVTGRVSAVADRVGSRAGRNWDKLESIFEQRTAKAMNRLGVPTAKDVEALARRVDALAAAVARLAKAAPSRADPKGSTRAGAETAAQAARPARAGTPTHAASKAPARASARAPAKAPARRAARSKAT
ncbi:MAG TPA: phasin family protein [Rubrivivax sp.]|nr:phasin family protein [Rubrivivax sp.]